MGAGPGARTSRERHGAQLTVMRSLDPDPDDLRPSAFWHDFKAGVRVVPLPVTVALGLVGGALVYLALGPGGL